MNEPEKRKLEKYLNLFFDKYNPSLLLEAGCGSLSHITIDNVRFYAGIDLSKERLKRNNAIQGKVVGDLHEFPFRNSIFNIVICWDVLEHLRYPNTALINIYRSMKKNGILVLAYPNLLSWKGIITKISPFWFHRIFYRYIFGDKRKKELDQFPTYFRYLLEPKRLRLFARSLGFSQIYFRLYEGPVQVNLREKRRAIESIFKILGFLSRLITMRKVDMNLSDCIIVFKKD